MSWLVEHAEAVTAVLGAIGAAWTFLARADKSIKRHLSETFATKDDLRRIEDKLDYALMGRRSTRGRRVKKSARTAS